MHGDPSVLGIAADAFLTAGDAETAAFAYDEALRMSGAHALSGPDREACPDEAC